MSGKTCCVTGHRDTPMQQTEYVKASLRREIEKAIADGYTCFMCGFAEGVDQYFAEIVMEKKLDNPDLQLIAVIPYRKRLENLKKRERTKLLIEGCVEVKVIREEYLPSVYSHRNRYMVENSDRVIAVYDGREKGGTVNTIRFTHKMKKSCVRSPWVRRLDYQS